MLFYLGTFTYYLGNITAYGGRFTYITSLTSVTLLSLIASLLAVCKSDVLVGGKKFAYFYLFMVKFLFSFGLFGVNPWDATVVCCVAAPLLTLGIWSYLSKMGEGSWKQIDLKVPAMGVMIIH